MSFWGFFENNAFYGNNVVTLQTVLLYMYHKPE